MRRGGEDGLQSPYRSGFGGNEEDDDGDYGNVGASTATYSSTRRADCGRPASVEVEVEGEGGHRRPVAASMMVYSSSGRPTDVAEDDVKRGWRRPQDEGVAGLFDA